MNDALTTINELKELVRNFSRERNWEQFHHPKELGIALACEVGEVLEHVRYRAPDQITKTLQEPDALREFGHELADCLWLLLRLADVTGVDLAAALEEKTRLAAEKYPVEKVYGRPDKYTSYL
jgi:dCTP diphosphatase